jgi:homoserine kinase type II
MAVYTEVSEQELEAFVAEYDIGTVQAFKGIAEGVENSNYLLGTERGNYFLTLYEKRVAPADLPFFLGLMEHLAARGIPCPTPIYARDHKALRSLAGRPAAIVTFLHGLAHKRIAPADCAELGAALARLHRAGADFKLRRANALSVEGWRKVLDDAAPHADQVLSGLKDELEREFDYLQAAWPKDLPQGVIHADLFPDNVLFMSGKITGLIDFYFACNDFLAYDLVICLNAWCFESDRSLNVTKARALLSAYRRDRPMSPYEVAALPILARGGALRFLLTRLYDWLNTPDGALVRPKEPLEYLHKLRFHRNVTSASAYGLE